MLTNIPLELRILKQWVVWRYEKSAEGDITKVPYSTQGFRAKSTVRSHWASFELACATAKQWNADGIGFVLSSDDPYTIIDLDNKPNKPATEKQLERHQKILQAFESYTELSTSGTGVHIVIRGTIPHGRNKDNVEVYSSARFMVFTGNVVKNEPIRDYQELLTILDAEMETEHAATAVKLVQIDSQMEDYEIMDMAMAAENGAKFNELCKGDWQSMGFTSQSEADLALLSIITFYTRDNAQAIRIFRASALGKREKAIKNNTYLNYTLALIRSKEPPQVDLSALTLQRPLQNDEVIKTDYETVITALECVATIPVDSPFPFSSSKPDLLLPPGIIGEIAQYIYQASVRPVKEYAMTAALAMVAGITGRAYNISNTGLNQYFVVLGVTGTGKEGMASGIDSLFSHARIKVPTIDNLMGPGVFASGQGFNKTLEDKQCFISILSEFAHMLSTLLNTRASDHQIALKGNLLKAYSSSGPNQIYKGTAYSNKENNIKSVRAPNVTILGECTTEFFFKILSEDHASDGFIPRLLIVEYTGIRPPLNDSASFAPSEQLVQKIADLATASLTVQQNNQSVPIQQDADAIKILRAFNDYIDAKMNSMSEGPIKQILNRSHIKALKLAGLLAVGVNPYNPIVTAELANWAVAFIDQADRIMTTRFQSGEVGEGDTLFEPVIRKAIQAYIKLSPEQRVLNMKAPKALSSMEVIPFSSMRDYVKRRDPFKNHKLGYSRALEIALDDMVKAGILFEIPANQMPLSTNGQKPKAYGLGEGYW